MPLWALVRQKPDYGRMNRKKMTLMVMLGEKVKIWTNKLGILQKTEGTKKWIPLQPKEVAGFPGTMTLLQWDPHQTSNLGKQEAENFVLFQNCRFAVNYVSKIYYRMNEHNAWAHKTKESSYSWIYFH